MTVQLQAVMIIAELPCMEGILLPRIDVGNERIDWENIGDGRSGGQKALLAWAYAIWTDKMPPAKGFGFRDPFTGMNALDPRNQVAVFKALAMRHGFTFGTSEGTKGNQPSEDMS